MLNWTCSRATIASARYIRDHEDIRVQHVIELHAPGAGPGVAVVDDEMVELDRVVDPRNQAYR